MASGSAFTQRVLRDTEQEKVEGAERGFLLEPTWDTTIYVSDFAFGMVLSTKLC
ncbi:hypothetical protein W911_12675 [Hyphomicrobium nitrativorans NL23]|uniref:Uncharacterized protein n=1 Tax=Hyphomicrobium nitrativorans NL23 TaxID=1029756 RepID=V5SIA1_9HYPH|nr:hypothetical protein W911_12675 [Hyphomicrobium nitrativorans NL23]